MTEFFSMSTEQLDWRQLRRAADILRNGGLAIYPTDACYALGCLPQSKAAVDRIYNLRQLKRSHDFTLLCVELKVAIDYVAVDDRAFKILKEYTPGPYTFILPAQRHVPSFIKNLHQDKKNIKTMGIRIPDHPILTALLELLGQPLLTSSLQLPGTKQPLNADDLLDSNLRVDLIIEAGLCSTEGTTVIDLTTPSPEVLREGVGAWAG